MMMQLFQTGPQRYAPDPDYPYAVDPVMRVDQHRLAFLVGLVALGLPFSLLVARASGTCDYQSISHFYYAQFWGDVFVGSLVFIGTFLIAYRGQCRPERTLASITGIAAYAVALFPTDGRGCELREFSGRALADFSLPKGADFVTVKPASPPNALFELFPGVGIWHAVAAAIVFLFLAWFCFCVFTRITDDQRLPDGSPTQEKRQRNRIYRLCGALILIAIVAIGVGGEVWEKDWNRLNLTFWFEALALWAFGLSWMTRGRFFNTMLLDDQDRADMLAVSR